MQTPGADSVTAKRNDKRTTYTKLEVIRGTYLGYRLYLNVHNPEKNVWNNGRHHDGDTVRTGTQVS